MIQTFRTSFFIILLFFFLDPFRAVACDCPESLLPEAAFEQADIVFVGKVVDINTNWMSGGWKVSFGVSETWKRRADKLLILETDWERNCGYLFKPEQTYLVYAQKPYTFKTDKCSGTKLLVDASEDLDFLGKGKAPAPSGSTAVMASTLLVLAIACLAFVGFIVLRKKLFKRS